MPLLVSFFSSSTIPSKLWRQSLSNPTIWPPSAAPKSPVNIEQEVSNTPNIPAFLWSFPTALVTWILNVFFSYLNPITLENWGQVDFFLSFLTTKSSLDTLPTTFTEVKCWGQLKESPAEWSLIFFQEWPKKKSRQVHTHFPWWKNSTKVEVGHVKFWSFQNCFEASILISNEGWDILIASKNVSLLTGGIPKMHSYARCTQ